MAEDEGKVTLSPLGALSVALGKVVTKPSLCSSAFRLHRLEIIMEGKWALDVFPGKRSISTLF